MAVGFLGRVLIRKPSLSSSFSSRFLSTTSTSLSVSEQRLALVSPSPLLRLRPLIALSEFHRVSFAVGVRSFSPRRNWNNRPSKDRILFDGCDYMHWWVVMNKPKGDPTRDEIIDGYIKTLAMVLGRLGEPFIYGQAVDPNYQEDWVKLIPREKIVPLGEETRYPKMIVQLGEKTSYRRKLRLSDGYDSKHWHVIMEKPEGDPTRDEIIDGYIKTLAMVLGSEEEARKHIYSVSTRHYFAFGALVSEQDSYKIEVLPNVRSVSPDWYLDVENKVYPGEPFSNGQAVPYDPKYHEDWVRLIANKEKKLSK